MRAAYETTKKGVTVASMGDEARAGDEADRFPSFAIVSLLSPPSPFISFFHLPQLAICSSAAVFFNHDMLLLIFGAKLKGDCEKLRSGPPQRSRQWTPCPNFGYVELEVGFVLKVENLCAIIGIEFQSWSDLNGGVAAVIGELDHGDAGTRKMDA
ncbi:hypothetical protein DVH24_037765 [Malus domestica]|uniref:Uncharacterized protein n=1 Tax=Malus domestica TaxID=3750 RepID=A0A498JYR2_MALDO|nr:hypothetical protein DVH24_037765 [Malus domestica]